MRILVTLALFLASTVLPSATLSAQEVDAVDWLDNYQEAVTLAKATSKPIFLEFRCEP